MIFFFTSHLSSGTEKFSSIVWQLGHIIQSKVINRKNISVDLAIYIGLICEEPRYEGFYKYRKPRLSRIKDTSGAVISYEFTYEFIIPYASVGQQDLVGLVKRYFLDSLVFFDKIKDFDTSSLKQDLIDIITVYTHEPVYLSSTEA